MDSNLIMRKDILPCISKNPPCNSSADTSSCSDGLQTLRSISKYLNKALTKGNTIKKMSLQLNETISNVNVIMATDKRVIDSGINSVSEQDRIHRNVDNSVTSSELNCQSQECFPASDLETSVSSASESAKNNSKKLRVKHNAGISEKEHGNKSNTCLTATNSNKHKVKKNSQPNNAESENDSLALSSEEDEALSDSHISNNSKYPNLELTSCKKSDASLQPGVRCYCLVCSLSVPFISISVDNETSNNEALNEEIQVNSTIKFHATANVPPPPPTYKTYVKELPVNTRVGAILTWLQELNFSEIDAIVIQIQEDHCDAVISFIQEDSCKEFVSLKGTLFKGTPVKIKPYYIDNDGRKYYQRPRKNKKRDNESEQKEGQEENGDKKESQKKVKKHHTKATGWKAHLKEI